MVRIPIEDMKSCIQEWFAQEYNFIGLTNLYVELRMEIDSQLEFMSNSIGRDMVKDGLFDKTED